MKIGLISTLLVMLPIAAQANLFDRFADVCLAPVLSGGQANTSNLKKIDPDDYGLKGGQLDYLSVFATSNEDYFFQLFELDNFQCAAHHFEYEDAELELASFDTFAQRFDLTRREDCDQTASGGQQSSYYYQVLDGRTLTTVWLNTDAQARVTWMGLNHAKNGSDCR